VKFESYSWWIAVVLGFESDGCETIRDYDGFEFGCLVIPRREIETRLVTS